jgi:hypothetical protein
MFSLSVAIKGIVEMFLVICGIWWYAIRRTEDRLLSPKWINWERTLVETLVPRMSMGQLPNCGEAIPVQI